MGVDHKSGLPGEKLENGEVNIRNKKTVSTKRTGSTDLPNGWIGHALSRTALAEVLSYPSRQADSLLSRGDVPVGLNRSVLTVAHFLTGISSRPQLI